MLGDFNSYNIEFGARHTDNRGRCLQEYADRYSLKQHATPGHISFRRGDHQSLRDLICTNNLTDWSPHDLKDSWVGSDHAITIN